MKILVVIPAYNEEANIERVVKNLIDNYPQYDYVVVNDGSKKNHFNLLDQPINLGLAGAFQTGMKYAYEMGYDAAIQFDGDGQHRPEYIEKMVQITSGFSKEGYQVILASFCREEGDLDAAREIKNRSEQQKNITIFDYDGTNRKQLLEEMSCSIRRPGISWRICRLKRSRFLKF